MCFVGNIYLESSVRRVKRQYKNNHGFFFFFEKIIMELENKLWKNSIYNELGGRTCKEVINVPFQELRA